MSPSGEGTLGVLWQEQHKSNIGATEEHHLAVVQGWYWIEKVGRQVFGVLELHEEERLCFG